MQQGGGRRQRGQGYPISATGQPYGAANQGPVRPFGPTVRPPSDGDDGLEVNSAGVGEVVVDVRKDDSTGNIVVTKGSINNITSKMPYGSVLEAVGHVVDIANPPDWEDDATIDHDTFVEGDALPANLPAGMMYVRLAEGARAIDMMHPTPDLTAAEWKVADDIQFYGPRIVAVRMANLNTVEVIFNENIDLAPNASTSGISIVGDLDDPLGVSGIAKTEANVIRVNLSRNRSVTYDELIRVRVQQGLVKDSEGLFNQASPLVPAIGDTEGYKFVLCINRTGRTIMPSDVCMLSGPTLVPHDASPTLVRRVYDLVPIVVAPQTWRLVMLRGNEIEVQPEFNIMTPLKGLEGLSTGENISEVPAADPSGYDPGGTGIGMPPGLGVAYDIDLGTEVWVASRLDVQATGGMFNADYTDWIVEGTPFTSRWRFQMPVTGTNPVEYAWVYLPWRL